MSLSFLAAVFCTAALGIVGIAVLVYELTDRRPEARFALVASLLLVFALLTLAPLVFLRPLVLPSR